MRFNPQTEHLMLSEATLSSESKLAWKQSEKTPAARDLPEEVEKEELLLLQLFLFLLLSSLLCGIAVI